MSSPFFSAAASARNIGVLIFFSRWLQAPLYIGLIIAQLVYVVVFVLELVNLIGVVVADPLHVEESVIMLYVLGLIDVVMIANLLIMVIIGGYETFVSKIDIQGHRDQPEWLSHVNANVLKVKLAMAIIGISSIHLLKTFIEVGDLGAPVAGNLTGTNYTGQGVMWQVIIHCVFVLSAVALAVIDRLGGERPGRGRRDRRAMDRTFDRSDAWFDERGAWRDALPTRITEPTRTIPVGSSAGRVEHRVPMRSPGL